MTTGNGYLRSLDRPCDGHKFFLDFSREIRRRRYPLFPSTGFFDALLDADRKDISRWVMAQNDLADDGQRHAVEYVDSFQESDWASLDGRHASLKARHAARRAARAAAT